MIMRFLSIVCILLAGSGAVVLPTAGPSFGGDRGFLSVRSYYPTDSPPSYESLYLAYRLRYIPLDDVTLSLSVKKGSGEPGYYPGGYFGEGKGGLYEQGSYYLLLEDVLGVKKIILGNYFPRFGQGLLYGGSYPLILSNPYYDLARYRDGVYPTATTSKSVLLEGIALDIELGRVNVRPFVSWNRYDCTAGESDYYMYNDNDGDGIPNDEDPDDFTGIRDEFPGGYSCRQSLFSAIRDDSDFGDENERARRNNLTEYVAGLNLSTTLPSFRFGWTVTSSWYDRLIDPYYDFDPEHGDKTSFAFRGKSVSAANLYFKAYGPVEVFGETAATFYDSLSYYPEFDGRPVSSFAASGGVRANLGETGLILWGSYVPPTFVNPHGQEYPEGVNNLTSMLAGVKSSVRESRYTGWIYWYHELQDPDGGGENETGISYGQNMEIPLFDVDALTLRGNLEFVDHHYYAHEDLSVRVVLKPAAAFALSRTLTLEITSESRFGGPLNSSLKGGSGLMGEIIRRVGKNRTSVALMVFGTADDPYARLYPYEPPLYNWSFISQAVDGSGLWGYVMHTHVTPRGTVFAAKLKGVVEAGDPSDNRLTVYLLGSFPL
jgi:hypothetical protein